MCSVFGNTGLCSVLTGSPHSRQRQGLPPAEAYNRAWLWNAMSETGSGGWGEDEKMVGRKQALTS